MFNFIPLLGPSIILTQIYEPNQSVSFGRFFRLGRAGNWILFPHAALSAEKNSAELKTKQLLLEAKDKAQVTTEEAVKKAQQILDSAKQEEKNSLIQTRKLEERILQREESLEKQRLGIEKSNAEIHESIEKLKKKKEEIEGIEKQRMVDLQKVASMTEEEAKTDLLKATEKNTKKIFSAESKNWNLWDGTSLKKSPRNTGHGHSKAGLFHRFGSDHHHRSHSLGRP